MSDDERGIYRKYNVTRTDGSSGPGGKHEHCAYFVLDLEHDPHAIPALKAYMESCGDEYPALADDIATMLDLERPHTPTFGPRNASEMARALMSKEERDDDAD